MALQLIDYHTKKKCSVHSSSQRSSTNGPRLISVVSVLFQSFLQPVISAGCETADILAEERGKKKKKGQEKCDSVTSAKHD